MKSFAFLPLLALAAPAVATETAQPASCAAVSQTTIEQQFERFNAALASKDPVKVAALFRPGAVLLPTVSNTPRTTPEAIRDYFEHFVQKEPSGRIDSSTVKIGCNEAERVGTYTWTLKDPATHQSAQVPARYSFVYRYENGQWWIDHLHSSVMPEK